MNTNKIKYYKGGLLLTTGWTPLFVASIEQQSGRTYIATLIGFLNSNESAPWTCLLRMDFSNAPFERDQDEEEAFNLCVEQMRFGVWDKILRSMNVFEGYQIKEVQVGSILRLCIGETWKIQLSAASKDQYIREDTGLSRTIRMLRGIEISEVQPLIF